MNAKTLNRTKAKKLIDALIARGLRLYAPVRKDALITFEPIATSSAVFFDYANSTLPPKGILFPQTEMMFKVRMGQEGAELDAGLVREREAQRRVIFGIRPCDALAFKRLNAVFSESDDPYYLAKAENTVLIGLACTVPGYNCFCTSLGGAPASKEGVDILLTELGGEEPASAGDDKNIEPRYHVEPVTDKGIALIDEFAQMFGDAAPEDERLKAAVYKQTNTSFARHVDLDKITTGLESAFESPLWEEYTKRCISCGVCTFLCPMCHCFDITEECANCDYSARVRTWDYCMSPHYTLQASGHNPRPARRHRLRNRVYHKFSYQPANQNVVGCVGCGRCIAHCPVNVDLIEILAQIEVS